MKPTRERTAFPTLAVLLCLSCALSACSQSLDDLFGSGEGEGNPGQSLSPFTNYGPFCGLYSLYAYSRYAGLDFFVDDFVDTQYVSSPSGSTIADLAQAADDYGIYTLPLKRMDKHFLQNVNQRMILHVKSDITSPTFDHYVLYLGEKDGAYKLIDPSKGLVTTSFSTLAALWDNAGLLLSTTPIDRAKIAALTTQSRNRKLRIAAAGLILLFIFGTVISQLSSKEIRTNFTRTLARASILLIWAGTLGTLFHLLTPSGFFVEASTVRLIVEAHHEDFMPKVSRSQVKRHLENDNATLIDARYEIDYQIGHLPGALNIPVYSTQEQKESMLRDVQKERLIILYCQNESCPFSGKVAKSLEALGYKNLVIYRGGWQDWNSP